MKIILVVATSQDGFITKGNDNNPSKWTSDEDKELFKRLLQSNELQVFGSGTYDACQPSPSTNILRVVLTSDPSKYQDKAVPGQLEFAALSPEEFIEEYSREYDSCLLLGGSYVYNQFLQAGVVDEIYQTIEPLTHGSGKPFIADDQKLEDKVKISKQEITQINDKGTILKHYILRG